MICLYYLVLSYLTFTPSGNWIRFLNKVLIRFGSFGSMSGLAGGWFSKNFVFVDSYNAGASAEYRPPNCHINMKEMGYREGII